VENNVGGANATALNDQRLGMHDAGWVIASPSPAWARRGKQRFARFALLLSMTARGDSIALGLEERKLRQW